MNLSRAGQTAAVEAETKAIIAEKPASTVATSARFARAMIAMQGHDSGFEQQMILVEDFIKAAPQDKRGGDLLMQLASYGTEDQARQTELLRRVQADYPGSKAAARAGAKLRQAEGVGKPFELAFTEAITGKPVSMSHLKGKVIVVDFWATWCGPCVAEMPHMKELYGQWKNKGVEFIGVSLDAPEDKGGLDDLKKFVAEHKIEWPQYYQGKGWESEFSSSWGIDSIPALFVVDADGNLFSTNARGKLEEMVPELIAKRDGKRAQAR
jgi:thiol-disulfide isomerase/thioredoxin